MGTAPGDIQSPGAASSRQSQHPRAPTRPTDLPPMTFLDPNFLLPHYENDAQNDQLWVCWPSLVAVAKTPRFALDHSVFHELSPLPGGFFLGGVGHVDNGSLFREQVMAHVSAGTDLEEAIRTALRAVPARDHNASVCYARFDPLEATFRIEGIGPSISVVHLTAGSGRLLPMQIGGVPVTIALRSGEALALIAHPHAWDKHVLAAIHQALPENDVDLSEATLQGLGAALDAIPGPSARLILYRSDDAGTPNKGGRQDLLMPTGELNTSWADADLEFLDELAGVLV